MAVVYKLEFYVPESHAESVKEAVFRTGAGTIGDYDRCCWQPPGKGQFRPLEGATPFLGSQGETERVAELKVELVCEAAVARDAVAALLEAHPYEEVAYFLSEMVRLAP